jgi:hypothetical protein
VKTALVLHLQMLMLSLVSEDPLDHLLNSRDRLSIKEMFVKTKTMLIQMAKFTSTHR